MICLSFDVEERFHSHLTPDGAAREWKAGDRIARLLDFLEEQDKRATFFLVGELAEHYPDLVRRAVASNCEVAAHSHTHLRLDGSDRDWIKADISRAKKAIEDIAGVEVIGFRAPSWTARLEDEWLWDHLVDLGFRYDASLFPFRTHMYGSFSTPVRPFRLRPELMEIPPSVWKRGPVRIPYGGGFWFRLYPDWLTRVLIASDMKNAKAPILYFHPWEFDQELQVTESGRLNSFIANWRAGSTWDRFRALVGRHDVRPVRELHEALTREEKQQTG